MTGLVPKPKCTIYTNLACDGNMMTFPYLKQKYQIPGFYIDVPYEKNQDSIAGKVCVDGTFWLRYQSCHGRSQKNSVIGAHGFRKAF